MPQGQSSQQWAQLTPDQRNQVLARMSPEQKQMLAKDLGFSADQHAQAGYQTGQGGPDPNADPGFIDEQFSTIDKPSPEKGFTGNAYDRLISTLSQPIRHPYDSAVGMGKLMMRQFPNEPNPAFERAQEFQSQYKESPKEAFGVAAGDLGALVATKGIGEAAPELMRGGGRFMKGERPIFAPPTGAEDLHMRLANQLVGITPTKAGELGPEMRGIIANQARNLTDTARASGTRVNNYLDLQRLAEKARETPRLQIYENGVKKIGGQRVNMDTVGARQIIPSTGEPLGSTPTIAQVDEALNAANAEASAAYGNPDAALKSTLAKARANVFRGILNRELSPVLQMSPEQVGSLRQQVGELRRISEESEKMRHYARSIAEGRVAAEGGPHPSRYGMLASVGKEAKKLVKGNPEAIANRELADTFSKLQRQHEMNPAPAKPAFSPAQPPAQSAPSAGEEYVQKLRNTLRGQ